MSRLFQGQILSVWLSISGPLTERHSLFFLCRHTTCCCFWISAFFYFSDKIMFTYPWLTKGTIISLVSFTFRAKDIKVNLTLTSVPWFYVHVVFIRPRIWIPCLMLMYCIVWQPLHIKYCENTRWLNVLPALYYLQVPILILHNTKITNTTFFF